MTPATELSVTIVACIHQQTFIAIRLIALVATRKRLGLVAAALEVPAADTLLAHVSFAPLAERLVRIDQGYR